MKPAKSALFLTLTLAFSCYAQQDDVSTEQIYKDFRSSQFFCEERDASICCGLANKVRHRKLSLLLRD